MKILQEQKIELEKDTVAFITEMHDACIKHVKKKLGEILERCTEIFKTAEDCSVANEVEGLSFDIIELKNYCMLV